MVMCITMNVAIILVFVYAPTEKMQGIVQKIFYFHVSLAITMFVAFFVVCVASMMYLWKNSDWWDAIALSAAEIGVVFCSLVLITGPIWARPVWGTWWQWDARLTSTLVLWLTYVGYLLLRAFTPDRVRAARLSAIVGTVGFIDVPIVHFSVYWWRTLHPSGPTPADLEANSGLGGPEFLAFFTALIAFTVLFAWLLTLRTRLGTAQDRLERLELTP